MRLDAALEGQYRQEWYCAQAPQGNACGEGRRVLLCGMRPAVQKMIESQAIDVMIKQDCSGGIQVNRIHALQIAEGFLNTLIGA